MSADHGSRTPEEVLREQYLRERWRDFFARIEAEGSEGETADHFFDQIIEHYNEPHRKYHTAEHIEESFVELDSIPAREREFRNAGFDRDVVEAAIWFHDLIYNIGQPYGYSSNEDLSSYEAQRMLRRMGKGDSFCDRVSELIAYTKHGEKPVAKDAHINIKVMVDIDLSILGKPPTRYERYERQVYEEYQSGYPNQVAHGTFDEMYISGRVSFMRPLAERAVAGDLYATNYFRNRRVPGNGRTTMGDQARINLTKRYGLPSPRVG